MRLSRSILVWIYIRIHNTCTGQIRKKSESVSATVRSSSAPSAAAGAASPFVWGYLRASPAFFPSFSFPFLSPVLSLSLFFLFYLSLSLSFSLSLSLSLSLSHDGISPPPLFGDRPLFNAKNAPRFGFTVAISFATVVAISHWSSGWRPRCATILYASELYFIWGHERL